MERYRSNLATLLVSDKEEYIPELEAILCHTVDIIFAMPYFCAVNGCGNRYLLTKTNPLILYHKFPGDGRLGEWISFCGQKESWRPQKNQGICSQHFHPSDYIEKHKSGQVFIGAKIFRKLNSNAIPTILSDNSLNKSSVTSMVSKENEFMNENCDRRQSTYEECFEKEMIIEKLDDSNDLLAELKIEPHSPLFVTDNENLLYNFDLDIQDIKEEIDEEPVVLPLPQTEDITDPLDIQTEDQLINQFCRLCLRRVQNLFPLMSRIRDVLVPEMFSAVTGFSITISEKQPKKVCINCLIRLDYAYNIRKEFLETRRTLNCFSMTRTTPLLEHLENYQNGIRLTTESYGEKILRQHKDTIRMRLIKKQEHMEKMVGDEKLKVVNKIMAMEKSSAILEESTPRVPSEFHNNVEQETDIIELEESSEKAEYSEEGKLEEIENKIITDYDTSQESVPMEPSIEKKKLHRAPQQRKVEKRRKGRRYNIEQLTETKPVPNKCYICEDVFENVDKLYFHLETHADMIPYRCEQCVEEGGQVKKINSLILLNRHFRMHAGSIKCPKCPLRTFTIIGFYQHMSHYHAEDSTTKYTCEICGHQMVNIKRFRTHMRFHKAVKEERFSCQYCDHKFGTKARLIRHERTHTRKNNRGLYECKYCEMSYMDETTLLVHERGHKAQRRYRCEICGRSYQEQRYLRYHIDEMHGGPNAKITRCEVEGCDFSTINRSKYYQHKAKHTLSFHCSFCSKRFPNRQQLVYHENGHTGVKPYCCDKCGKAFRSKNCYDDHMNGHRNIRPHSCEVCGMAFFREQNLREHRRKHSDTLNYQCRICSKKFRYRAGLSRHERTHKEAGKDQTPVQYEFGDEMKLIDEDFVSDG